MWVNSIVTNGVVEIGFLGLPWLLFGMYALLVALVAIAVRTRERDAEGIAGANDEAPIQSDAH